MADAISLADNDLIRKQKLQVQLEETQRSEQEQVEIQRTCNHEYQKLTKTGHNQFVHQQSYGDSVSVKPWSKEILVCAKCGKRIDPW